MSLVMEIAVGLAVGSHIATWGMYKDAPHEGFTYRQYFRSYLVSAVIAVVVVLVTRIDLTSARCQR